ncbi:hypothetical protein OAG1_12260 [Agarivorans sp. OAG1]|nr:hypothetical protein OAG1_12260 [Agarivorans sp. OAG1]
MNNSDSFTLVSWASYSFVYQVSFVRKQDLASEQLKPWLWCVLKKNLALGLLKTIKTAAKYLMD